MLAAVISLIIVPIITLLVHELWRKRQFSQHWIVGPDVERKEDLSCGFGSENCSGYSKQSVILGQGDVIVVDDFLDTAEYELLSAARLDSRAFQTAHEPKTTPPFGHAAWMSRSSMPRELEGAMEQFMKRTDGYVARQIRVSSSHTSGPWSYKGAHYPDLWDLRHYVVGKRRDVHLDTGSFARCLCAMLYLGGSLGAETGKGGHFRTHQCRTGKCNHYAGWQHFGNATPLPRHLVQDGNLRTLTEVPYKPGRIVFFLAETLHDVTEVTQGHQDAMLIWWDCTPSLLTGVVTNGHVQIMDYLMSKRAKVDEIRPANGDQPMHRAALSGHVDVVELLSKRRASVVAVDAARNGGAQPMHNAAHGGHTAVMEVLANKGASVMATSRRGLEPIHNAALSGHLSAVKWLTAGGSSVDAALDIGTQPMHLASMRGHAPVVDLLASLGASVGALEAQGSQPIHAAVQGAHTSVLELLVSWRASVAAVNGDGVQPIHVAAHQGDEAMVQALAVHRACIAAVEERTGAQPLHLAADRGHVGVVEFLIEQGASITAHDKQGIRPVSLATQNGHAILVQLLTAQQALQKKT